MISGVADGARRTDSVLLEYTQMLIPASATTQESQTMPEFVICAAQTALTSSMACAAPAKSRYLMVL
jgi:hypothetical protein